MRKKKIPGIYNYCDRWCERCTFTSRCAIYKDESTLPPEEKDFNNKAFWERLASNFDKAISMLLKMADGQGIDVKEIESDLNRKKTRRKRRKDESRNNPLIALSHDYALAAHKWLLTQPGMLKKLKALRDNFEMGITSYEEVRGRAEQIIDCLEVIRWYEVFISAKLVRALMGKVRKEELKELDYIFAAFDDFPDDSDGSAKIALVAIDRSTQAWITLFDLLPDEEDHFLKMLSTLEKLKSMVLKEFPNAMAFRRPGFDD